MQKSVKLEYSKNSLKFNSTFNREPPKEFDLETENGAIAIQVLFNDFSSVKSQTLTIINICLAVNK